MLFLFFVDPGPFEYTKFSPNNKNMKQRKKFIQLRAAITMTQYWHDVQMFRAFFIFDAPAIVLATEARLAIFSGNISNCRNFCS